MMDRRFTSMPLPDLLRLMLWSLWGLALTLILSAGLWGVLSAAGDSVGSQAALWMTVLTATLTGINLAAIVVTLARHELE